MRKSGYTHICRSAATVNRKRIIASEFAQHPKTFYLMNVAALTRERFNSKQVPAWTTQLRKAYVEILRGNLLSKTPEKNVSISRGVPPQFQQRLRNF